jgi:hypothetical protein
MLELLLTADSVYGDSGSGYIAVLKRGEVCPRRPMPYAHQPVGQIVPHVTEKGYNLEYLVS